VPSTRDSTTTLTVWKFPIPFPPRSDVFEIEMPAGAQPLTLQMQYGEPQIWALCDPAAPKVATPFRIAGTGHPIEGDVQYLGSFQVANGALVFHVFMGVA
jgi:hypothetical protein